MAPTTAELRSIMFIDIVNYTDATTKMSRQEFTVLHDTFDHIVLSETERFAGTIIKKIGDAFLITFQNTTDAVHSGVELQRRFHEYNTNYQPIVPIHIRVAIHVGEVLLRDGDIYGDAVNLTFQLESIAKPNQILLSETAYLAANKNEISCIYLGRKRIKGNTKPIRVYQIMSRRGKLIRRIRTIRKRNQQALRSVLINIIAILIIVFMFIIIFAFFA